MLTTTPDNQLATIEAVNIRIAELDAARAKALNLAAALRSCSLRMSAQTHQSRANALTRRINALAKRLPVEACPVKQAEAKRENAALLVSKADLI